jgi:hypothetical protein
MLLLLLLLLLLLMLLLLLPFAVLIVQDILFHSLLEIAVEIFLLRMMSVEPVVLVLVVGVEVLSVFVQLLEHQ